MRITVAELVEAGRWQKAGVVLPKFDIAKAAKAAQKSPRWLHFGAGNIFRAFPAAMWQKLLDAGEVKAGLIAAEGFDYEIVDRLLKPHDNLTFLVTLKSDGALEKSIIASVTQTLKADSNDEADFGALRDIFKNPSLQMVSFTITEKGYVVAKADGSAFPDVAADFEKGPARPQSYMGKVAALVLERFKAGKLPLALVSMDNCSHNGDKLRAAIMAFAEAWAVRGLVDTAFLEYLRNPKLVSFPWSMIDKITPRPDEAVKKMLADLGVEGLDGLVTTKNTFVAPFVNAEETEYLVIEDWFPAGRPPLDKAGVIFSDRETVDKVEKMKVCTCLNPLHTALAIFGCLLGYTSISAEMKDAELVGLISHIGYQEGLPVVVDPGILNPREFIDTVIKVRLPNPFMPDTPQRIATDTSQKLSIRFGETIKAYIKEGRDLGELRGIPLVLAAWCRYLLAVDDEGKAFAASPDPLYDEVAPRLKSILRLGEPCDAHAALGPILSNPRIFGLNLYNCSLGERVEALFAEMIAGGPGAVRRILTKHIAAFK